MNEKRGRKGPNWRLLLLIPAVVILVKGAMYRRARWESAWGASGAAGRGYGHHGRFGGRRWGGRWARRVPAAAEDRVDARHVAHPGP